MLKQEAQNICHYAENRDPSIMDIPPFIPFIWLNTETGDLWSCIFNAGYGLWESITKSVANLLDVSGVYSSPVDTDLWESVGGAETWLLCPYDEGWYSKFKIFSERDWNIDLFIGPSGDNGDSAYIHHVVYDHISGNYMSFRVYYSRDYSNTYYPAGRSSESFLSDYYLTLEKTDGLLRAVFRNVGGSYTFEHIYDLSEEYTWLSSAELQVRIYASQHGNNHWDGIRIQNVDIHGALEHVIEK